MKRKLVAVITVAAVSMGLLACGSKSTASPDTAEVMEEEPTPEEAFEEEEKPEVSEEPDEEAETENEEVPEQEEDAPTWYMNEEGLKSEELGIKIRRDSAEWEKFGFSGSLIIPVTDNNTTSFNFTCYYYGGDLDSYISEHKGTEKVVLDDVVYALKEPDEHNTIREVTFVGNGIALTITLWENDIKDIMNKEGLSVYEADDMEYLAYFTDDTLYCPALGIKCSYEMDDFNPSSLGIYCADWSQDNGYKGGSISISEDYWNYKNSAEETIIEYVKGREEHGETAIDRTIEMKLGKYQFLGGGTSDSYGGEDWVFYSNDTISRIYIEVSEGRKVEDYLSLIEELQ